jgi:hypothetical protein
MAKYDTVVGHAAHKVALAVVTGDASGTGTILCTGIKPGDTPLYGLKQTAADGRTWTAVSGDNIVVSDSGKIVISSPTAFPTDSVFVFYSQTSPIP